jgi:hypothetical protein
VIRESQKGYTQVVVGTALGQQSPRRTRVSSQPCSWSAGELLCALNQSTSATMGVASRMARDWTDVSNILNCDLQQLSLLI